MPQTYGKRERGRSMATYLVDLENTGLAGLTGLEELSVNDKVIVFYGTRTGAIAFDKHVELTKAKADVTYSKTERVAKNYLDFQLATYLGYLIGSGQERVYYIISKDKGYESCIEFWKKADKQITITRCESLQKSAAQMTAPREKTGTGKSTQEIPKAAAENGAQSADKDGQEDGSKQSDTGRRQPGAESKQSDMGRKQPGAESKQTDAGRKQTVTENKRSGSRRTSETQKLPECMRKKIRKAVKEEALASGSYKLLYDYVVRSPDKHELNVALVKGFQQEKGNRLYKEILDVFVEYQKQQNDERKTS